MQINNQQIFCQMGNVSLEAILFITFANLAT